MMTELRVDPVLVELAKVLTDVDVVVPPVSTGSSSASAGMYGEIDQQQAARVARIAADDVIDTVIGSWDVLAPGMVAPERLRLEWFVREDVCGTVALPEASATARAHVEPELVEKTRQHLLRRGWLVKVDALPGGLRLLAHKGHVYVQVQVRGLMGLVFLRARTAPLPLGQVGAELYRAGPQIRPWR